MWNQLVEFIRDCPGSAQGAAVAFSGGADSALVVAAALEARKNILAVYFSGELRPGGESEAAARLAESLGARFVELRINEVREAGIQNNPPDRCYRCKKLLYGRLKALADQEGISLLLDGANADDADEYRPGMRARAEYGVRGPLLELGIRKQQVRELLRERGLAVAEKPSSPCLATRFEYGAELRPEDLEAVRDAECYLQALGFPAVRVRRHRALARIEVPESDLERILKDRSRIVRTLEKLGFVYVTLELGGLQSGSMDRELPADGGAVDAI